MICVRLMGGLGNQLFQYATGRALAARCRSRLWLDASFLAASGDHTRRRFELPVFRIEARIAPAALGSWTRRWGRGNRRQRVLRWLPFLSPLRYLPETPLQFTPSVLEARGNVYLDGFWQSERYFGSIRPLLLKELDFAHAPDDDTARLVAEVRSCASVAVHVRRGDYVTSPAANEIHGVLGIEYYRAAVEVVRQRVPDPVVFVFSDDPEWAAAHLTFEVPTVYVSHNQGARNHEDLRIMRTCRHQIIANSSFSWWGAWLNQNPAKVVVAPRRWYRAEHPDVSYMIPDGWIRL